ncbi:MAG: AHH domain-containing protein, partial [Bacteroidota bacterium]
GNGDGSNGGGGIGSNLFGNSGGGFDSDFFQVSSFWDNLDNTSPVINDLANLVATHANSPEFAQNMIEVMPFILTDCISNYTQVGNTEDFAAQYGCMLSSLLAWAEEVGGEENLITAFKARAVQIAGLGDISHYQHLIENPEAAGALYEFMEEVGSGEATSAVINLFFQEVDLGLDHLEYGTQARFDLVDANVAFYAQTYEEDTGEQCCPGLMLPDPTPAGVRLHLWHATRFEEEVAYVMAKYPNEYDTSFWYDRLRLKLYVEWRIASGGVHTALDIIGLFPGAGEPADLINAVFYTIEGDGTNAALSLSAMLPVAGWASTGSKYIRRAVDFGNGVARKLGQEVIDGIVVFSPRWDSGRSWKQFWGFTGSNIHGHHIIPKSFHASGIVQMAAKADSEDVFHIHHINNGFPLPANIHNAGHGIYNNNIQAKMEEWMVLFGSTASNEDAARVLKLWQDEIKLLLENTNLERLDDLVVPNIPAP